MDWFSDGIQAMTQAFGGRRDTLNASNPFRGRAAVMDTSFAEGNPFGGRQFTQPQPFMGRDNPGQKPGVFQGYHRDYGNPMEGFARKTNERLAKLSQQSMVTPGKTGSAMGKAAATGASFAMGRMDDASEEINAAASKYGVPANLVKAIVARESSGDWGRDGSRYVYLESRGEHILPYSGIMESTARAWGYDPRALIGNRAMQFDAVANGLSRLYQQVGAQYGWDGVINTYYSGDPSGGYTPGDSTQYGTTQQYTSQVKGWWDQLDQLSGSSYDRNAVGGGVGGSWTTAWGGSDAPITQEFGMTDFAADVLAGNQFAGMYDYGASVGVRGHAGLDIGLPHGSKLYTPAGGTVVIAGGSTYYRDASGDGPGRGELRIEMDNGDILILGHMSGIALRPGQRVEAGAYVGTSGSFNGAHLHYEVRKRTPGATSSGYTAVDPRTYFGSGSIATPGASVQTPQRSGLWWQQGLSSLFRS